jgi:peptide/nickel transport system ATP-binding protein
VNSPSHPLLDVSGLTVRFASAAGALTAVNDLSFTVEAGETLAIIGESGCGKSVTGLALMRLLAPSASIEGQVRFEGRDLLTLDEKRMRGLRGNRIAMVFQDPMSALNPVMTVGDQLTEAIRAHAPISGHAARARAADLFELVRIPEPRHRLAEYPHRFSGGMRQRVMIAMALAGEPALLIADEPTTALDVTIQAQILKLLSELQRALGMALILITHDLGVVAECAHRVLVMYAGRRIEERGFADLFADPWHPYTRGLIAARPNPSAGGAHQRLSEIPGMVPSLAAVPPGCAFAPRCPIAAQECRSFLPEFRALEHGGVACHKARVRVPVAAQ